MAVEREEVLGLPQPDCIRKTASLSCLNPKPQSQASCSGSMLVERVGEKRDWAG